MTPLLNFLSGDVWNEDKRTVSAPTAYGFSSLTHSIQ